MDNTNNDETQNKVLRVLRLVHKGGLTATVKYGFRGNTTASKTARTFTSVREIVTFNTIRFARADFKK